MSKDGSAKRLKEIVNVLRKHNLITGMTPQSLRAIFEELGPTCVKVGQILSMQPNILPAEYCKELEKLRSDVAPMDFKTVKAVLEEEYGKSLGEVFSKIDETPLGSASIGQVHLAYLPDGTKVVVKVQRPGVYETMSQDIHLIKKASGVVNFVTHIGGEIDINMVVDEVWEVAKQEMDYSLEAGHAEEFHSLNKDVAYVTCPKIFTEYSTSKVLIEEHVEGFFVDNLEKLKNNGYDMEEISEKIALNFVKQVIDDGFFHADPHCGNIKIQGGKIVWIDLGMMGRLSPRDKNLFADAVMAMATRDSMRLTDFVLNMGIHNSRVDYLELESSIETVMNRYASADFGTMDIAQLTEELFAIMRRFKIGVPKGVSMLPRSMSTIHGTLQTLNPGMNAFEIIAEYMSGYSKKHFDLKAELTSIGKRVVTSIQKSLDIPAQISDALRLLSKGFSKVNLELSMSDDMDIKINGFVNKIVIALIASALLIGSSVISTTYMQPQLLGIPAIGAVGFFAAIALVIWLIVSIIRKPGK
ncbi:MAG: AarF/UbiB family protein [Oscillospiraceae bacterium]|nr:AarF/UbiB family protein [Oscillospiraceae bacterium]